MTKQRLIVAVTGATGATYAHRLLLSLKAQGHIETHVLVSNAGWLNLKHELNLDKSDLAQLADVLYNVRDVGATLASGSFKTAGMLVVPCSMKTLASIAHGLSDNLISRAADVILKERRRLVLMVRETPFNLAHLRNMTAVTEMGGVIYPPLPTFYHHPKDLTEMVDQTLSRVLDMFDIEQPAPLEWQGINPSS